MRRFLKPLTICLSILIALGLIYAGYTTLIYRLNCPTQPRAELLAAPTYPNVTRVITTTMEPYIGGGRGQQIFMTADTPESVVAFYTEHLRNQEWREMDRGMDKNGFNWISFSETQQLPVYSLDIYTKASDSGTLVKLNIGYENNPCLYR